MKKLLMISLLTTLLYSCKHDKVDIAMPYVESPCWQKFVGTYTVYDTANGSNYIMKIRHFSVTNHNGGQDDSLAIQNFANNFDLKYAFICGTDPNRFQTIAPFPCFDHNNKRWSLTCQTDDITTPIIENRLNLSLIHI